MGVPVGEGGDEIVSLGDLGGGYDVLVGNIPSESDVLLNGIGIHEIVLEHHAE